MIQKNALSSQKLSNNINQRWSPRSFNKNKKLSKEQIITLAEAARWSASCANEQPWNILFINYHINEESYNKLFECLDIGNQNWCKNVNTFAIVTSRDFFIKTEKHNRWAGFDCGSASTSLHIQARELGLITHPMGGFSEDKIKENFNIPENHTVYAVIAIGYQDTEDKLDEPYHSREKADRIRKPLSENFFFGDWGSSVEGI